MTYCVINNREYAIWPLKLSARWLLYFYWIFYNVTLEIFLNVYSCDGDTHKIDKALNCYGGPHIALVIVTTIFLLFSICIAIMVSLLLRQSHPTPNDVLADLENPLLLELIFYKTGVFILCSFDESFFGVFIIKYALMICFSLIMIYQYIKYIPYFDEFVSTLFGYFWFLHIWTIAISIMTYIIDLTGHYIMFLTVIIPLYLVVRNIRKKLIDNALLERPDKITLEREALMQCYAVNSLTTSKITSEEEIRLIGLVNLHQKECKNKDCALYYPNELYDPCSGKFVNDGDVENLHKNQVFLKHFTKYYFDTAVSNFGNMPGIRLSYAFFLFHSFKNVHAALTELVSAKKNKPNIMQNFEIYKFQ